MNRIVLTESDISRFKKLKNQGIESTIYEKDNLVYKILKDDYRISRESMIVSLHEKPIRNFVKIDSLLVNEQNNFIGYSMENLRNFSTLYDYACFEEYDFNKRKRLALEMAITLEELIIRNYYFQDAHNENIMIGSSLKFIDIDSTTDESHNSSSNIQRIEMWMRKDILILMIELLTNRPDSREYYSNIEHALTYAELAKKHFNNNPIVNAYINDQLDSLLDGRYTIYEILELYTEKNANELYSLIKKYSK